MRIAVPLLRLIAIFLMSSSFLHGQNLTPEDVAASYSESDPISLFNGENLDGWYTFIQNRGRNIDPIGVYSVRNGLIRISGEEWGGLTTEEEFENYRIIVAFKWGDITFKPREKNARDSGLLLHCQGEDGGAQGIWMHSIECQIIEGGTGDFIVIGDGTNDFQITTTVDNEKQGNSFKYNPDGSLESINAGRINWLMRSPDWKDELNFRGKDDVEYPAGEWNTLECFVFRDEITIFLNGELVNKATNVKPQKGKIQIQSEGAEIFFREITLIPLTQK